MNVRLAEEAGVWLACLAVCAFTFVLLGFAPGYSVMGNDGPQYFLPMLSVLSHVHGDWPAMTYRPEFYGGTDILGMYGILPVSVLFAMLRVPPVWNLNLTLLGELSMLAYFATQGVRALAVRDDALFGARGLLIICGVTWVSAFSSVIAFRVDAGHLYYITALVAMLAVLTVWVSGVRGRSRAFTLVLALCALLQAFCVQGFQILLYGAFFGAPLLVALGFELANRHGWRRTLLAGALCAGLCVAAFAMAWPIFSEMLAFAQSGDTPRRLGHDVVTYSYFTPSWREVVASLFWFRQGISHLPAYQQLEVGYGIGPALMLAVLVALQRRRAMLAGFALSLVLAVAFATDVAPIAGWLVHHIPLLADFRVPTRVFLPLFFVWGLIALAALLCETARVPLPAGRILWTIPGVMGVAFGAGRLLPAAAAETLVWGLTAALMFTVAARRGLWAVPLLIAALVCLDVAAFARHVPMVKHAASALAANARLGRQIGSAVPALTIPLTRADVDVATFGFDMSPVGRIATITGYGFPPRRFSMLMHDLVNAPWSPTRVYFDATGKLPDFGVPQQLYNIGYRLHLKGDKVVVTKLAPTPGAAWASRQRRPVDGQHRLDAVLKRKLPATGWQDTQYVDRPIAHPSLQFDCAGLHFAAPRRLDDRRIEIGVTGRAAGPCPVTVSLTWADNLRGRVVTAAGEADLALYPAYGTLVGMLLPAGAHGIVIGPALRHGTSSRYVAWAGLLLAAMLVVAGALFDRPKPT